MLGPVTFTAIPHVSINKCYCYETVYSTILFIKVAKFFSSHYLRQKVSVNLPMAKLCYPGG